MNRLILSLFCVSLLLLFSNSAQGYHRKLACEYAQDGGDDAIYNNIDDSASFISQCLIAGRYRFRSSYDHPPSSNDNTLGGARAEMGQGSAVNTYPILSEDLRMYSRTIEDIEELYLSVTSQRHSNGSSVTYSGAALGDGGTAWQDENVVRGDLVFKEDPVGEYVHVLMITAIDRGNYELTVCSKAPDHTDAQMSAVDADWRTNGNYKVVHLPNAPIEVARSMLTGTVDLEYKWGNGQVWYGQVQGSPSSRTAAKAAIGICLRFDVRMNVDVVPTILLVNEAHGVSIPFQQITSANDPRFNDNGWLVDEEQFAIDRTWEGYILGSSLPYRANMFCEVRVRAQSRDGVYNDFDNDLAIYEPTTAGLSMDLMKIKLDTRQTTIESWKTDTPRIQFFIDDQFTQTYSDWPQEGSRPRQPKYLCGHLTAPIYVQVTGGEQPLSETGQIEARIYSDSDPTGLNISLKETGSGTNVC